MSNRAKFVNQVFVQVLEDDSLLVEVDDTRAALKAFKRWRHMNISRRNTYYDKIAQLYVFKEDGKKIVTALRRAGFHIVEGLRE